MKKLTVLLLLGSLFACSSHSGSTSQPAPSQGSSPANASTHTVVLNATNMSFQSAEKICAGTLGSVTFNMGHARAHAVPGVQLLEHPESSAGVGSMTFTDRAKGTRAAVSTNGHARSVTAKNVTAKNNRSVACIGPD